MKTFAKIVATIALMTAIVPAVFAQTPPPAAPAAPAKMAPKMAKMTMGRKGGYVHATTYTTKAGKTVTRKGYYRHSTKKAMTAKKTMMTAKKTTKM